MSIVGSRFSLPVPISGMAGDERPAKRVKLAGHDAEPDTFAQGDFASGVNPYGGFLGAASPNWNMPDVFDPGWKWEAASSTPNDPGLLLPLLPTDDQWRSSQMSTMDPYPGMTRSFISCLFLV